VVRNAPMLAITNGTTFNVQGGTTSETPSDDSNKKQKNTDTVATN
jgi:hypothetical protein